VAIGGRPGVKRVASYQSRISLYAALAIFRLIYMYESVIRCMLISGSLSRQLLRCGSRAKSIRQFFSESGDPKAALWGFRVRVAGRKASGVCVTPSMEGAQAVFGSVRLNFEVIGDGFAFRPIAKDHFVFGVFEQEALQHGEW
jgi:hypothetical protein